MIDSHTHLNFKVFEDKWKEVVSAAVKAGVEKMIVVGTDIPSSKRAVKMADEHEALFASVGIHPHHAKKYLVGSGEDHIKAIKNDLGIIEDLAGRKKVIAIGEVGLDKHKYEKTKYQLGQTEEEIENLIKLQKMLLTFQVRLAIDKNKPVILHSREMGDEVLAIVRNVEVELLKSNNKNGLRGVFHCFEGSKKYAKQILNSGFYFSFTGNITYAFDRAEVAKTVPLERLLLETDSPFMTPLPKRGSVNVPANVRIVASHHAKDRNIDVNTVIRSTTNNALKLFGL